MTRVSEESQELCVKEAPCLSDSPLLGLPVLRAHLLKLTVSFSLPNFFTLAFILGQEIATRLPKTSTQAPFCGLMAHF